MITVAEKLPHNGMQKLELEMIDKVFECIKCGKSYRFFSYSERICSRCGASLPPIDRMLEDELQRKMYHFDDGHNLIEKFLNIRI